MNYRKNVADFKLTWCQTRMRRYDWKNVIGQCLKHVPWDAISPDKKLQTQALRSYVKQMDIRPAGFFSKIYIQSVSVENVHKTIGGDSWRVDIRGPSNMAATVYDKDNGLYEAVFLPQESGSYWAEIVLDYSLCEGFKDPPLDWFIRGNKIVPWIEDCLWKFGSQEIVAFISENNQLLSRSQKYFRQI